MAANGLDLAVYCCMARRIGALLVAGGLHHDFDFVRRELLKRMAKNPAVHTTVSHDFSDLDALRSADFLVSYTCNVRPTATEEQALRSFVAEGGRWLALHATNAIADLNIDGLATATTGWSGFFELLGTKFIAHPDIRQFDVKAPEGVSHPLLGDIRNFRTNDEIYLVERTADIDVLLETTYVGPTTGIPAYWHDETPQPVLYIRRLGRGSIVYLTLGHASEQRDPGAVERCSWEVPEFLEILERAFEWAWSK
jgi:type 1 glutamine amidotransferase